MIDFIDLLKLYLFFRHVMLFPSYYYLENNYSYHFLELSCYLNDFIHFIIFLVT